jgi:spermidine synthase
VAEYPGTRVDVVELVPDVIAAARYFGHVNGNVVDRPGVRLLVDDGRNYLLRAVHAGRRYDVITADIIRPHHAGAANLYSLEYYRLAAAALRDDGVMLQWLDPSPMHRHQLMLRTFLSVFPHATLWLTGDLVVGSKRPLNVDEAALARRVAGAGVSRAALAQAGIGDDPVLRQWFLARDDELRAYAGHGPVLTDDRPATEYFRSLPPDDTPIDLTRFSRQP